MKASGSNEALPIFAPVLTTHASRRWYGVDFWESLVQCCVLHLGHEEVGRRNVNSKLKIESSFSISVTTHKSFSSMEMGVELAFGQGTDKVSVCRSNKPLLEKQDETGDGARHDTTFRATILLSVEVFSWFVVSRVHVEFVRVDEVDFSLLYLFARV
jgi:hypothetical protein